MPHFNAHIEQAQRNLQFLKIINEQAPTYIDWQVTTCFYAALHLINAHIAKAGNMQFRNHSAVKNAISPSGNFGGLKLPEEEYACYESLFSLSRRARYLINDKDGNLGSDTPAFTSDKHLGKSIRHLDKIAKYFSTLYNLDLPKIAIKCSFIRQQDIHCFKVL